MGRFTSFDGAIMLVLQMLAVAAAIYFTKRLPQMSEDPELRWRNTLILGIYSFLAAFAAHIIAFGLLKNFAPEIYNDPQGRRPYIALTWALATFITARLSCRGRLGNAGAAVCGLLAAVAYFVFVVLRA